MTARSLEVLVEELSAEFALRELLPKLVPGVPFEVRVFQGKPDLLKKLPSRLAGYATWIRPADVCVVVLVDRDDADCDVLRRTLDGIAAKADLQATGADRIVLNRIAIERLEAWFFGDVAALVAAFPRLSPSLGSKRGFRDPDAISGGTAEALGRVLASAGYQPGGLQKVSSAQLIAPHMNVDDNRSRSFQVFRDGVRSLVEIGDR